MEWWGVMPSVGVCARSGDRRTTEYWSDGVLGRKRREQEQLRTRHASGWTGPTRSLTGGRRGLVEFLF